MPRVAENSSNLLTGAFTDELVDEALLVSKSSRTVLQALADPLWLKAIHDAIQSFNNSDECVHNNHRVQKFFILPTDLSVPGGELTPTMKLRRSAILAKYDANIDAMYTEGKAKL